MRNFLLCMLVLVLMSTIGFGQEKVDVVYLKNGDVRKGTIIENVPNDYIKVETNDGSIFTVKYSDIQKIAKEAKAAASTQSSSAQEFPKGLMARHHDIGFSAALWLGGEMSIGSRSPDKDAGFLVRAFYDEYLMEKLGVGAYINFSPVSLALANNSETMFEIGVSIKPRFPLGTGSSVLKIGLNIGYRMITMPSPSKGVDAMGLNFDAEVQFDTKSNFVPYIEIGFLAQPVGGTGAIDVSFAPIIYFGGGVAF
jgi:hypothetical protein